MKSTKKKAILAALAAAFGLALSAPALAGGKHHHGHPHHRHGHHGHHHHHVHRHVVHKHVVVHRPVYVAPVPVAPVYVPPPRHPGIVVSVDIPLIVIPLR